MEHRLCQQPAAAHPRRFSQRSPAHRAHARHGDAATGATILARLDGSPVGRASPAMASFKAPTSTRPSVPQRGDSVSARRATFEIDSSINGK